MLLIILLSVAVAIFVIGNAVRIVNILRMPAPLRWELYPIPKGPGERQRYGGSYFEESEWWSKPQDTGYRGELAFMAKEVLLLKSVREGFRELWLWSWLLHGGLYLYLAATLSAIVLVLTGSQAFRTLMLHGYWLACWLGLLGSLGLLVMRSSHPRLRPFTTRSSVFNLALLGSIFASGLLALIFHSRFFTLHLLLVGFFLAYFPFTHMTHAYMKFFSWHGVRWDDRPAMHDPASATQLTANLAREITWAAPHIAGSDLAETRAHTERPQGLKPDSKTIPYGTAEAVPLQNRASRSSCAVCTATWSQAVADARRAGAGKHA